MKVWHFGSTTLKSKRSQNFLTVLSVCTLFLILLHSHCSVFLWCLSCCLCSCMSYIILLDVSEVWILYILVSPLWQPAGCNVSYASCFVVDGWWWAAFQVHGWDQSPHQNPTNCNLCLWHRGRWDTNMHVFNFASCSLFPCLRTELCWV